MAARRRQAQQRSEGLSRERIVGAAVELLDATGEAGLTFRTLTQRLATGPGAIYWHVANKDELLDAATDAVVTAALATRPAGASDLPEDEVRSVALGLFDAIEEHPWLATQLATRLARNLGGALAPRIYESFGRPVRALGVPERDWFVSASALVHYVLGAAGQNATNSAIGHGLDVDRAEFLDSVSAAWEALDPDEFGFARVVASQMREHDDREQFLAGVDLVLAGIAGTRRTA